MRIPIVAAFLLATAVTAPSQTMSTAPLPAASAYTGVPGDYIARDFHFGTGETLPELKLHYLTLGTPHRDAAGHVDNAVLLLHGTGGDAHSLLNPLFSNVLFGPGRRSTSRNTSSSSPTTSATAKAPSPPTACTRTSPPTTTTTWCAASA